MLNCWNIYHPLGIEITLPGHPHVPRLLSQTLSTSLIRSIRSLRANTVLVLVVAVQKTGKPNTALDFIRISSCLVRSPVHPVWIFMDRDSRVSWNKFTTRRVHEYFFLVQKSSPDLNRIWRRWWCSWLIPAMENISSGALFLGHIVCVCVAIRAIHSQIGLNQWPIQIGYWTPQLPFAPWNTSPRVVGLTTWLDWGDEARGIAEQGSRDNKYKLKLLRAKNVLITRGGFWFNCRK